MYDFNDFIWQTLKIGSLWSPAGESCPFTCLCVNSKRTLPLNLRAQNIPSIFRTTLSKCLPNGLPQSPWPCWNSDHFRASKAPARSRAWPMDGKRVDPVCRDPADPPPCHPGCRTHPSPSPNHPSHALIRRNGLSVSQMLQKSLMRLELRWFPPPPKKKKGQTTNSHFLLSCFSISCSLSVILHRRHRLISALAAVSWGETGRPPPASASLEHSHHRSLAEAAIFPATSRDPAALAPCRNQLSAAEGLSAQSINYALITTLLKTPAFANPPPTRRSSLGERPPLPG